MLRDRRYLALVIANVLAMTIYSLWTNWTTVFLVSFVWLDPAGGQSLVSRGYRRFSRHSGDCSGVAGEPGDTRWNGSHHDASGDLARRRVFAFTTALAPWPRPIAGDRGDLHQSLRDDVPECELLCDSLSICLVASAPDSPCR